MATKWVRSAEGIYRKGKSFYLRFQMNGQWVEDRLGAIPLVEARRIHAERRSKVARDVQNLEPLPCKIAVVDVINARLSDRAPRVSPRTIKRYTEHAKHLIEHLGALDARALSPDDWDRYIERRREGAGNTTVNKELGFLRSAILAAVGRRVLTHDPLAGVETLPEPEPGSVAHEFSDDEVARVIEKSSPRFARLFITLAETGCRLGELTRVPLSRVDDSETVEVPGITFNAESVKGRRGKRRSRWIPLSNGESRIFSSALDAVRKQIADAGRLGSPWLFPSFKDPRRPLSPDYIETYWKRLKKRAEILGRPHDFRHTFITRMLLRGQTPSVIAKIVGHATTQMIERTYGHLWRGHREDLVEAIHGRVQKNGLDPAWTPDDSKAPPERRHRSRPVH